MTNDTEKKLVWRMGRQGGEWSGKPSLMRWGAEVSHRIPGCGPSRQREPGWCRAWTVRSALWLEWGRWRGVRGMGEWDPSPAGLVAGRRKDWKWKTLDPCDWVLSRAMTWSHFWPNNHGYIIWTREQRWGDQVGGSWSNTGENWLRKVRVCGY